jgi:outer membrane protein assembly factor BamA
MKARAVLFEFACLCLFSAFFLFEGDVFARASRDEEDAKAAKKSGIAALPVIYYTPETRWALGAGGLAYFSLAKTAAAPRPSNLEFALIYTLNKQFSLDLNPDLYLSHGYHVQFELQFSKFPDKFFGVGNETPASREEPFTSRFWKLNVEALKRATAALNLGFQYAFDRTSLVKVKTGGMLASGSVTGSPGGVVSGLGPFLTYDTRDSIFFPTTGSFHQVSAMAFGPALGSDFAFGRFCFDLRRYIRFSRSRVLALQSQLLVQTGDPPFWRLGMLGGETGLRGYYLGRYRDRNLICVQAEYRWVPVVWRLGLAGFVGLGEVADRLDHFEIEGLKPAGGLGLRLVLDAAARLHVRLDFAFGERNSGIYLTAGEAF